MVKHFFYIIILFFFFNAQGQTCQVGFTYSNNATPFNVVFTDTSKLATAWNWNFGDGTTSNLQNPTHLYSGGAIYTVCLKITNTSISCSDSICVNVIVYGTCFTSI